MSVGTSTLKEFLEYNEYRSSLYICLRAVTINKERPLGVGHNDASVVVVV